MTSQTDDHTVIPTVRWSRLTRAVVIGSAVLWTYALVSAGFAAWSVHRQRLSADPRCYERRRLITRAERVYQYGSLSERHDLRARLWGQPWC